MADATPTRGCELDTDGDGNCPRHPAGCPTERCVHCGELVMLAGVGGGWWVHSTAHGHPGKSRCQSPDVAYGHLAHPEGVPCRADGPNPCLGARS